MARLTRVDLPGHPHHIIQRGNRRQDVFFRNSDYAHYLALLAAWCEYEWIEIRAYCLMTNHVHLIVKPARQSNLSKAIGETYRRYTRKVNFRDNWKFISCKAGLPPTQWTKAGYSKRPLM